MLAFVFVAFVDGDPIGDALGVDLVNPGGADRPGGGGGKECEAEVEDGEV